MLMRHNKAIAAVHGYSCYIAHAQAASQTVMPVSTKCLPIMIMMVMIIITIIIIIVIIIIIIIIIIIKYKKILFTKLTSKRKKVKHFKTPFDFG